MSEVSTSPNASFIPRLTQHTVPIVAVALGLFAFHWQALHAEEQRVRERSDVRAETLVETASLALRDPLLPVPADVPSVMMFVEGLVRENHDVLSARVGRRDGKTIAETQAEHVDEAESSSTRALTQPIVVHDAGSTVAIGTIDLRVSTKEVDQVAAANTTLLWIEGGLCLLLCGGLVVLSRKRTVARASSSANRIDADLSKSAAPRAAKNAPASSRGKREKNASEPRGPQPAGSRVTDDEPVEVSLTSPPPPAESR